MTARLKNLLPRAPLRLAAAALIVAALSLPAAACTDVLGGSGDLEILWPTRNATLYDEEVLRVRVRNRHLDDYDVYWYVDNGVERRMWNEWDDRTPHKVYLIDTWEWTWNGRGPYTIGFVAEDYNGRQIARRTVQVYVE